MENLNLKNIFRKKNVTEPEKKVEKKDTYHKLTQLPDGTLSEDITPEEYQDIQRDK